MIVEKKDDGAHITDFVISCRVADKKIEPTIVNYLAERYNGQVFFHYKKTSLNGPMYKTIEELGMNLETSDKDFDIFKHLFDSSYGHVVSISQ